jgi:glutathione-independent formaldehyde dehydrogenase
MRALIYKGPYEVAVEEVADARIDRPTDVLVKVTSTNICGSDLHMYEGRTDVEQGKVLGHENLGEVIEVGPEVSHEMSLDEAPDAYRHFDNREAGWTKVVLHP